MNNPAVNNTSSPRLNNPAGPRSTDLDESLLLNSLPRDVLPANSPTPSNGTNNNALEGFAFDDNKEHIDVDGTFQVMANVFKTIKPPHTGSLIEFKAFEEKVVDLTQGLYDISKAKRNGAQLNGMQNLKFTQDLAQLNKFMLAIAEGYGIQNGNTMPTPKKLKIFFDTIADPSANYKLVCDLNGNGALDPNDLLRAWVG